MFKTLKNGLKTPEIRKKLFYTVFLIAIFRLGCYITVPGVNAASLLQDAGNNGTLSGLLNLFSGGAFQYLSIFAMSISPYITATIVMQLLGMVIPALERLTKDGGETGRQKINKYTKILTIVLALVQGIGVYLSYKQYCINPGLLTGAMVVSGFVAGTSLLMWIGEQITNKGIGNGTSLIIFIGIISRLVAPETLQGIFGRIADSNGFSTTGFLTVLGITIGAIVLIAAVVFVQQAERRIPVQYSKKVVGRKMMGAQNTHIPLKPVMAGVMPIIFASSFLTFPAMILQIFIPNIAETTGFWHVVFSFSSATTSSNVAWGYTIANILIYVLLIVGFTYFWTYAMTNPAEISNTIKKNGGFIPGIRAGKPTTDYLTKVMSKITIFGGFYLALIAILPMLLKFTSLDITFGGTAILIVVGVAIESIQQLESQLVMRHYKGFLE